MGRTTTVQSATSSRASRRRTPVLAHLLVAASVTLAAVGCAPPDDPPKRNACAAANRTPDELHDALDVFHLALPADATEVSFARSGGSQAYSLTLVFRTTPDGLADFIATSKLPTPSPDTDRTPAGQPPLAPGISKCGLDDGFNYSVIVDGDSTFPSVWRSFAVDNTNSNTPRVLVVATVL